MGKPTFEIVKAMVNAMTGNTTLMSMVTGVFNWVPENQAYPYITLGDDITERKFNCFGRDGKETTVNVHVWSKYKGSKEVMSIVSAVNDILDDATLSPSGHTHILISYESDELILEEGVDDLDKTRHGVIRYRIITQEG